MSRWNVWLVAVVAVLGSSPALAQWVEDDEQQPFPAAPPVQPVGPPQAPVPPPVARPAAADEPVEATASALPPSATVEEEETTQDPGGRLRWGVSGNLGWHFPHSAFTLGLEGRFGYQVSDLFGAYAILGGTAGFGLGGSVSPSGALVSAAALARGYLGAIAELLLRNTFFVGAGPVFALGLASAISPGGTDGVGTAFFSHSGPSFGLDVRLGVQLGRKTAARKSGFSLGLSALTLLHPDTTVVRSQAGMNGGTIDVTTTELMVTFTPMLMLGFDWR